MHDGKKFPPLQFVWPKPTYGLPTYDYGFGKKMQINPQIYALILLYVYVHEKDNIFIKNILHLQFSRSHNYTSSL
jgi:hypothetical protein